MKTDFDDDRRSIVIRTRLTPQEFATISDAAARIGVSLSTYIRNTLLGVPIIIKTFSQIDPRHIAEIKSLGINLNQLTRGMWRGRTDHTEQRLGYLLEDIESYLRTHIFPDNRE